MSGVRGERVALGIGGASPQIDAFRVLAGDQQVARAGNVDGFDRETVLARDKQKGLGSDQRERKEARKNEFENK